MDDLKDFITGIFSNVWTWVVIAAIALVMLRSPSETTETSNIDPFSGPLVVNAPGCVIKGPDGKSLENEFRDNKQVLIPEGSTLNSDCFPAAKAARNAHQ